MCKTTARFALAVCVLSLISTNLVLAQARRPDPREYVDVPVQSADEVKRTAIYYPPGPDKKLSGWIVDYKDGKHLQQSLRTDGNLSTEFESYMPGGTQGMSRARREYDVDGKTIIKEERWGVDGNRSYSRTVEFNKQFTEVFYRSDGTRLSEKRGVVGGGSNTVENIYYVPNGNKLVRTTNGTVMNVRVYDAKDNELYQQTWMSGIAGYILSEVKQPLPSKSGWRIIHVAKNQVKQVQYFRADGSLEKEEDSNNLSAPVDPSLLDELDRLNDPTAPKAKKR